MIQSAICRGRARTVEDAVEAWKRNSADAEKVKDIETIVHEWLELTDCVLHWHHDYWNRLRRGVLAKAVDEGNLLASIFEVTTHLHGVVNEGVLWAEAQGYVVDRSKDFHEKRAEVKAMSAKFGGRRPRADGPEIEAALAAAALGEVVNAEDWLRELHSPD